MFALFFVSAYVVAGLTVIIGVLAAQSPRGDLRSDGHMFTAPPRASLQIWGIGATLFYFLIGVGYLFGGATPALRVYPVIEFWGFGMLPLGATLGSLKTWYKLTIGPDGVTVYGKFKRRTISWPDMSDPKIALVAAGVRDRSLPIQGGGRAILRLRGLAVEPERILEVLTYYYEHPDARNGLGNPSELACIPCGVHPERTDAMPEI